MNVNKLRLGAVFHFVEDGTEYGDPVNEVSDALFPDFDTDPEPWNVNPMGGVYDSQITPKFEESSDICYEDNGYRETMDRRLSMITIGVSLRDHSELIHRLIWMFQNKIADGVAQAPFTGSDFIDGWARLVLEDDNQAAIYSGVLRARMRLDENPLWSKDPSKPAITLEIAFRNALNTMVPDEIIGA